MASTFCEGSPVTEPLRRDTGHVVIVGAGLGGDRVAVALRLGGYEGRVTVVGNEHVTPYDRPPLSKQVLQHGSGLPMFRGPEEYEQLGIALKLGVEVTGLDSGAHRIQMADGTVQEYDKLVVATGAAPRRLAHLDEVGAYILRTYSDAQRLRTELGQGRRLAVIGGGFIGCEVAASARSLGASVTVVEQQSTPLARLLGPEVGNIMRSLHERNEVTMMCGRAVEHAARTQQEITLNLDGGERLYVDTVVVGIGTVPALGWLDDPAVECDDGILCDSSGRTSVPDLYAIGDAARWLDPRFGRSARCEHWTATANQASIVAHALLTGEHKPHVDVPYVWSDQFGQRLQVVGWPSRADNVEVIAWGPKQKPVVFFSCDGDLTGGVGLGAPTAISKLRGLLGGVMPKLEDVRAALC